jgi:two-component system, OmpR family, response regulator
MTHNQFEAAHHHVLHRALVIDGTPAAAQQTAGVLEADGICVEITTTVQIGFEHALAHQVGVVVLAAHLPDSDGLKLIRQFRTAGIPTPIIVQSTEDSLSIKARWLELGAADYVTPSMSHREFTTRVASVVRRAPITTSEVIRFADVVMDERSHQVYRAGRPLDLSLTLYRLLRHFMLNPGQSLSKETLFLTLWRNADPRDLTHLETRHLSSNAVQISVSRLRKSLGQYGPPLIYTVRSRGYILLEPPP